MCKSQWKQSKRCAKVNGKNLLNMWILFNFIGGKVLPLFCKYTPFNIKADIVFSEHDAFLW
jgi:hypothetical protein